MKILILNPNYIRRHNWGHQLFKNEFERHHEVTYYGKGYKGFNENLNVPQILKKLNKPFDIILTYEIKYSQHFKRLGDITDIPKIHIQIDYSNPSSNWKGFSSRENVNRYFTNNKYDLFFVTSSSNVQLLKDTMKVNKVFMLPFSVDTRIYKDKGLSKLFDVMATFSINNKVYPLRRKIQRTIKTMGIKTFTKRVIHQQYINAINQSKIFVISNNFNRRLSMKYTEAMAIGTFVLADEPEDFTRQGFENGKHLVLYKGLDDLKEKIEYYLLYEDEREEIAKNGMNFVRKKHSCERRVKQFIKIVKKELVI